jgi:hypothetical protein
MRCGKIVRPWSPTEVGPITKNARCCRPVQIASGAIVTTNRFPFETTSTSVKSSPRSTRTAGSRIRRPVSVDQRTVSSSPVIRRGGGQRGADVTGAGESCVGAGASARVCGMIGRSAISTDGGGSSFAAVHDAVESATTTVNVTRIIAVHSGRAHGT